MNDIYKLSRILREHLPGCQVKIDKPDNPKGSWFLDAGFHGNSAAAEWRPGRGFGIQVDDQAVYGEGPHEVLADHKSAALRLITLLLLDQNTSAPLKVSIKSLRRSCKVSQKELARKLGKGQGSVSKAENRGQEIQVGTLNRLVAALGGRMSIRVRLPNGTEQELLLKKR
ncbi:MAG: helix-turn-helix transcriptional regulator [Planctomycetes bacterium]|nr:helix-turn-helix transcriptional regulator [Planctomycetota bacterium]